MGGKGSSPQYIPQQTTAPQMDMSPMYLAMGQMQQQMAEAQMQNMRQIDSLMASAPKPTVDKTVDWKNQAAELKKKIAADYDINAANRRGRESTIITSPLTDTDVALTDSVLTGS
jgi:hypothetical protein